MSGRKTRSKRERYAALVVMDFTCPIYNDVMELWECHLDHIIPLAAGGVDDWENLIVVNSQINLGKGSSNYPVKVSNRLLKLAKANEDQILALLANPNFVVDPSVAVKVDLQTVTADEILAETGSTKTWDFSEIKYMVVQYLRYGVHWLEKIANKLGRTLRSIISKLANMHIYNNAFEGQR